MKSLPSFFTLFFLSGIVFAQTPADSLRKTIPSSQDTAQVIALNDLAAQSIYIAPDKVEEWATEAAQLAERLGYTDGLINSYRLIGNSLDMRSKYPEAIKYYEKAQRLFPQTSNDRLKAGVWNGMGVSYYRIPHYEKAVQCFYEALPLAEAAGDIRYKGIILNNIGLVFHDQKDYEKALTYYRQAYAIGKNQNYLNLQAYSTNNIGIIKKEQYQYDSAILFQETSLQIKQELGDQAGIASSLMNLGSIYKRLKQYDKAMDYLNQSEAIKIRLGDEFGLIQLNDTKIEVYLARKMFAQAKQLLDHNLAMADSIQVKEPLQLIYGRYADYYKALGDYQKAIYWIERKQGVNDSLFNETKSRQLSEMETLYKLGQKEAEIKVLEAERDQQAAEKRVVLLSAASALVIILLATYWGIQRQKQKQKIAFTEKELAETQLQVSELKTSELQKELDFKNRELVSYTMNFIQKSKLLEELGEVVNEVKSSKESSVQGHVQKLNKLIASSGDIDRDWEEFRYRFEQIHPQFFTNLKKEYPEITSSELKLCALIRLNFNLKESAQLLGISPESVKTARYRLRKKLKMDRDDSLATFMMQMEEAV